MKVAGPVKLVLASASPRRASLLREAGYHFDVVEPNIQEPVSRSSSVPATHWAEALSYFKARSVAKRLTSGYVLAADTVVALKDRIFCKPTDVADAQAILETLMGTTHRVITGVTLLRVQGRPRLIRHAESQVALCEMSEQDLAKYLDGGLWRGKAGAYGVQDGDANIEHLDGSRTNVVGLPLELLEEMLIDAGIRDALRGPATPEPA